MEDQSISNVSEVSLNYPLNSETEAMNQKLTSASFWHRMIEAVI